MSVIIEAKKVTQQFRVRGSSAGTGMFTALDSINLRLESDRPVITAVAGESGSGKTTLARILLNFYVPSKGEILFHGVPLHQLSHKEEKNYRMDIQAIFQDPFEVYNPFYKVDNILETPIKKFNIAGDKEKSHELIVNALQTVGLRPEETLGRFPHQLSGGQRQRIMIARALLLNPKVIIADEPVSMVDASIRAIILDNLLRLNKNNGISILYITHDLTTAYQLCDNIIILYRGQAVEIGDIQSVIKESKHPYTRLLINSIPLPNPEKPWGGEDEECLSGVIADEGGNGCLFAPRCKEAMDVCHRRAPGMYRISDTHCCSCFLYEAMGNSEDMDVILQKSTGKPGELSLS